MSGSIPRPSIHPPSGSQKTLNESETIAPEGSSTNPAIPLPPPVGCPTTKARRCSCIAPAKLSQALKQVRLTMITSGPS